MTMWIKICGLSDDKSIDAAVTSGAQALGFVFAKSVRQVTPQLAQQLSCQVPREISKVAVFLHPEQQQIDHVLSLFAADCIQADWRSLARLKLPEEVARLPVYREGRIPSDGMLPDRFLYEGLKSGHGETVDWTLARDHAKSRQMVLAGGLSSANVTEAIKVVEPFGVDVSSGVESEPGKKDCAKIKQFIEIIRHH